VSEQRYPGTCFGRYSTIEEAEHASGRQAGLRLMVPSGEVCFDDRVYGRCCHEPKQEVGDFLILRRDKTPSYQLAVVVDDAVDGVSEVVRGRDLLSSTARQVLIAEKLGLPSPSYAHLPLVCDHRGVRLAKRNNSLSLAQLRMDGVSAEAIVGWAALAAGQTTQVALTSAKELIESFDWRRMPQADVVLPESLNSLWKS
jgi:glutamyl-tRNA synthetase